MRYLLLVFTVSLFLFPLYGHTFAEDPINPWGADNELVSSSLNSTTIILKPSQVVCQKMILFFQNHISPIDGPRSSFYPTSSQYTLEAIMKYGALKGIALGCDRLMRENKDWWIYETKLMHGIDRKLDPVR